MKRNNKGVKDVPYIALATLTTDTSFKIAVYECSQKELSLELNLHIQVGVGQVKKAWKSIEDFGNNSKEY